MIHPVYIVTRLRLAWHHRTTRPNPNTLCRWVHELPLPTGGRFEIPAGLPKIPSSFAANRAVRDYLDRVRPSNYNQWVAQRHQGATGWEAP